jgi:hypothetical protein
VLCRAAASLVRRTVIEPSPLRILMSGPPLPI